MIKYILYDVVYFVLWIMSRKPVFIKKDDPPIFLWKPTNDYYLFVIVETIDVCIPTFDEYKKRINKIK